MKKIVMQPNQDEGYEVVEPYKGWEVSDTWGAFRTGHTAKLPWTLYHMPTCRWVASFPRKEHVVWLTEELDSIGDWTDGVPQHDVSAILAAFRSVRQRVAIDMAERALASARKKEEKDGLAA